MTQLQLAGGSVAGCGVSLDGWRMLFDFHDGSWLAAVGGEDHDQLTLISVDEHVLARLPKAPFAHQPASARISPAVVAMPWLTLTPEVARSLGYDTIDSIEVDRQVRATLRLHDDFLFSITRREPNLLDDVLGVVVRVHQFYLRTDLTDSYTSRLIQSLARRLHDASRITIQSLPERKTLLARYRKPLAGWWNRLMGRTQPVDEIIACFDEEAAEAPPAETTSI